MGTSQSTGAQQEPSAEPKRKKKSRKKRRPKSAKKKTGKKRVKSRSSASADGSQVIAENGPLPATPKLVEAGKDSEAQLRDEQTEKPGPPYSLGELPSFRPDNSGKDPAPVAIDSTACLVHGIQPRYLADALERGALWSAYTREGPNGEYSRDMDKRGGGASAVYTRAVGTKQRWNAGGFGVGSDPLTKLQVVMSPAILQDEGHAWRAAGFDGAGKLPGPDRDDELPKKDRRVSAEGTFDEESARIAWSRQTERGRNLVFNDTVRSTGPSVQNEQMHYEKLPLTDSLKALVCTSDKTFTELETMGLLKKVNKDRTRGVVVMGGRKIPVLRMEPKDNLVSKLKSARIADADGRVR